MIKNKMFLKTLSYAAMHMVLAILVAYTLSGSWQVALAIGLIEPCVQTVGFYFHEKAWHRYGGAMDAQHSPHNSVIDSASPITGIVENTLMKKNGDDDRGLQ